MTAETPRRPPDPADLFDAEPVEPFDPLTYLFWTATIAGARDVAGALGRHTEVWELRGRYYPVKRGSSEADILRRAGAELLPAADDALHMEFDALLRGLQRTDRR
jgi:hypothetical protein